MLGEVVGIAAICIGVYLVESREQNLSQYADLIVYYVPLHIPSYVASFEETYGKKEVRDRLGSWLFLRPELLGVNGCFASKNLWVAIHFNIAPYTR